MARMKQTARKGSKGLPKATKGRKGCGASGGGSSGSGSGSDGKGKGNGKGNGDGKGKALSGWFRKQLEHRSRPAVPKRKKPYMRVFQEMRKLQKTTKLCISKYQMAR